MRIKRYDLRPHRWLCVQCARMGDYTPLPATQERCKRGHPRKRKGNK